MSRKASNVSQSSQERIGPEILRSAVNPPVLRLGINNVPLGQVGNLLSLDPFTTLDDTRMCPWKALNMFLFSDFCYGPQHEV